MRFMNLCIFLLLSCFVVASNASEHDGEDIIQKLRSFDSVYESAFTATGTNELLLSSSEIPPHKKIWKLVLNDGQIAYEEEVVEIYKRAETSGKQVELSEKMGAPMMSLKKVIYFGNKMQAKYDFVAAIPSPGILPEWPKNSSGLSTCGSLDYDDPDAPTYNYQVKQALWSMGRGFSKHITNILEAKEIDGGRLQIVAEGTGISYRDGAKWELIIDPSAAYMVRSAKLYERGNKIPIISTNNSGIKWEGSRCVPENCTWESNYFGKNSIPIKATKISGVADQSFIEDVKKTMRPPYLVHTDVTDERMTPPLTMQYRSDQLFPKGARKNDDDSIIWENLSGKSVVEDRKESKANLGDTKTSQKEEQNAIKQIGSKDVEKVQPIATKKTVAWVVLPLSVFLLIILSYCTFRKKGNNL